MGRLIRVMDHRDADEVIVADGVGWVCGESMGYFEIRYLFTVRIRVALP